MDNRISVVFTRGFGVRVEDREMGKAGQRFQVIR